MLHIRYYNTLGSEADYDFEALAEWSAGRRTCGSRIMNARVVQNHECGLSEPRRDLNLHTARDRVTYPPARQSSREPRALGSVADCRGAVAYATIAA